jgi:hypothetical protein
MEGVSLDNIRLQIWYSAIAFVISLAIEPLPPCYVAARVSIIVTIPVDR